MFRQSSNLARNNAPVQWPSHRQSLFLFPSARERRTPTRRPMMRPPCSQAMPASRAERARWRGGRATKCSRSCPSFSALFHTHIHIVCTYAKKVKYKSVVEEDPLLFRLLLLLYYKGVCDFMSKYKYYLVSTVYILYYYMYTLYSSTLYAIQRAGCGGIHCMLQQH